MYTDDRCGLCFTKILDSVPSFTKVHGWSLWFALCNAISPQPANLKVSVGPKLGAKCVTKCTPQGPSMYFWQSWGRNALQRANDRD
ncbi:hypothetical protein Hanom_Chr01g00085501 [Helianthus anomalus]